jgi:hypothetical protein
MSPLDADCVLQLIRDAHERHRVIWSSLTLIQALKIENTARNRRCARQVLRTLWERHELVRRKEGHSSMYGGRSNASTEVAYSLPGDVKGTQTTDADVYDPRSGADYLRRPLEPPPPPA